MEASGLEPVTSLRELIRTEHGFGRSIRGHRDKVPLTRRHDNRSPCAVRLELPWMHPLIQEVVKLPLLAIAACVVSRSDALEPAPRLWLARARSPSSCQGGRRWPIEPE